MSLEYLKRLPPELAHLGNSQKNEIEIIPPDSSSTSLPTGILYEDKYILLLRDQVRFPPPGGIGTFLRIIEKPALNGPVGIVALCRYQDEIFFCKTFRHATRSWEIECVRGLWDEGKSAEEMLQLEIDQEIGGTVAHLLPLGELHSNSGMLAGRTEVYGITLTALPGGARPEASEAIAGTVSVPVTQLDRFIQQTPVRDAFTLSAITLARAKGFL